MDKKSYHHGNLRQALIDAALDIIRKEGLTRLTLRKAARSAGVSHGAPAHHFGDLRGLLAAIGERGYRKLYQRMRAARQDARGQPPEQMLLEVGLAYFNFAFEEKAYFQVMYHPQLADKSAYPALEEKSHRSLEVLVGAITECQKKGVVRNGEPRQLALLAFAAIHGMAQLSLDDHLRGKGFADDLSQLARQLLVDLFIGLRSEK